MSLFKKLKSHLLPHVKAAATGGFSLANRKERSAYRHANKSMRKKIGLTGKKLKSLISRSSVASPVSTSAFTEGYRYQPRPISSLM